MSVEEISGHFLQKESSLSIKSWRKVSYSDMFTKSSEKKLKFDLILFVFWSQKLGLQKDRLDQISVEMTKI